MKYEPEAKLTAYLETLRKLRPEWLAERKILCGPLQPDNLRQVVDCMRDGGVVVFFSKLTYGVATNAWSRAGVDKVYAVKGRSFDKGLAILGTRRKYAGWVEIAPALLPAVNALVDKYWPGGLNLVLPKAKPAEGDFVIPDFVTANMSTVALMCMDEVAEAMADMADFPIAATSANLSGEPPITDPIAAIETFGELTDKILVGSSSEVGVNTTILDLCSAPPRILRPGPVPREEIATLLPSLA